MNHYTAEQTAAARASMLLLQELGLLTILEETPEQDAWRVGPGKLAQQIMAATGCTEKEAMLRLLRLFAKAQGGKQ